jgi:hypothetical protein
MYSRKCTIIQRENRVIITTKPTTESNTYSIKWLRLTNELLLPDHLIKWVFELAEHAIAEGIEIIRVCLKPECNTIVCDTTLFHYNTIEQLNE